MVDTHFIRVVSFLDFARFACSFREYPLPVFSHKLNQKKIFSCRIVLSNSILSFFTDFTDEGRYILYDPMGGKETAKVVSAIKTSGQYAPIIHVESLAFPIKETKRLKDKFVNSKIRDLGSLVRLTYDPEFPDESKVTLICFPLKKKWILGYITVIDLNETKYCLNYVELDSEPTKPFVKYSGHEGKKTEFTDKFQHGYPYLPIVKLTKSHPVFGLK